MHCDGVYGCLRNRLLPNQDVRIKGKKMENANEGAAPHDLLLSDVRFVHFTVLPAKHC